MWVTTQRLVCWVICLVELIALLKLIKWKFSIRVRYGVENQEILCIFTLLFNGMSIFLKFTVCVCVSMDVSPCQKTSSLHLPCGFLELKQGYQAWQQSTFTHWAISPAHIFGFFLDRGSCSPDWPWTCYADKNNPEFLIFLNPHAKSGILDVYQHAQQNWIFQFRKY